MLTAEACLKRNCGDSVSLYGTGFGSLTSGVITFPTPLADPVAVTIGGEEARCAIRRARRRWAVSAKYSYSSVACR